MLAKVLFLFLASVTFGQRLEEPVDPPHPYSFSYDFTNEFGTRLAQAESGDENNVKTGTYSYSEANGIYRTVNYIADKDGFRVTVDTNEPGTKSSAPADVIINSQAADVPPQTVTAARTPSVVAAPAPAPPTVAAVQPARYVAPITIQRAAPVRLRVLRPTPANVPAAPAPLSRNGGGNSAASFTLGNNPPLSYTLGRNP
ncbi:uncharacterized protein LOC144167658 [Haemaphysalis longicornis]